MSEIKHTPLPWIKRQLHDDGDFFLESPKDQIGKPYGQEILGDDYFSDLSKEADCDFVLEACNNYYKLKEQNEKLKEALEKIQNPVLYLQKQAEASGAKIDGLMAVALSKDCEWLKNIAYETLKSCES